MLKYDSKKTKELLDDIVELGEDVTFGSGITSILSKEVIEVRLTSGKGKFKTTISARDIGVDSDVSEDAKNFLADYLNAGSIGFFSKAIETRIVRIQAKARTQLSRLAIASGVNGSYLTKASYRAYKAVYMKYKEEFLEERDSLIDNYEANLNTFKKNLEITLKELGTESIMANIISKFPTKDEIKKNFYMDLIVTPYPVLGNYEEVPIEDKGIFDDAVKGHESTAIDTFYGMIQTVLSRLFERTEDMLEKNLESDFEMSSRSENNLRIFLANLRSDNDILKNQKVSIFIDTVEQVFADRKSLEVEGEEISINELAEMGELILSKIYSYAKYLGIEEGINSKLYSGDDLATIAEFKPDIEKL